MKQAKAEETKDAAAALDKKIDAIDKGNKGRSGIGSCEPRFARLIFSVESADVRPADTVQSSAQQSCDALDKDLANWQQLNDPLGIAAFNAVLTANQQAPLPIVTGIGSKGCKP